MDGDKKSVRRSRSFISGSATESGNRDYLAVAVFLVVLAIFVAVFVFLMWPSQSGPSFIADSSVSGILKKLGRYIEGPGSRNENREGKDEKLLETEDYVKRGRKFYNEENFNRALEEYSRALDADPENQEAYYWRGRVHIKTGEYESAISDFRMAVKLMPSYSQAYDNLGWLYSRKGEFDKALACLNRSIELNSNNDWAYLARGRIFFRLGEREKALKDAESACRLGSDAGCRVLKQYKTNPTETF